MFMLFPQHVSFLLLFFFWYFPLTVATKLVNFRGAGGTEVSKASAEQIQLIGFTVLGLYLMFYVVSDIVYWISILIISGRDSIIPIEISADQKALMVATIIEFIFASYLLLGSKGIARLIRKFRYGKHA